MGLPGSVTVVGIIFLSAIVNLLVGSAPHGAQTGRMLEAIEQLLSDIRPAMVIVFGDTNSTLAAANTSAPMSSMPGTCRRDCR